MIPSERRRRTTSAAHADGSAGARRPRGREVTVTTSDLVVRDGLRDDDTARVVLLATKAEFPGRGFHRPCSLSDVDVLVTTPETFRATADICRDAGGKVLIA